MRVCECTTEGTVCVVRGGWELNCDRKKRWKKWRKERRTKPKCRDRRNRADDFSRNLLRVIKKTNYCWYCDHSRRVGAWGGSRHGGFSRPSLLQPVNHARLERLIFVHALWLQCVHARVGRCEHTGVALGLHLPVCVYVRGIRRAASRGDDDPQQFECPPPPPSRRRRGAHGGISPTLKGEAIVNPPTFPTCWVVEQAAFLFAVRGEERDVAKQLQFTPSPIFIGVD